MRRVGLALLAVLAAAWTLAPAAGAIALIANVPRPAVAMADPSLGLEPISFRATDGVRIAGWLLPAAPGAPVVVLIHGFKADRREMLPWARFLHAAGYATLLFDRRGCGESEGWGIGLGVTDDRDVLGAVRYVRDRLGDVRVAALGLSLGAGIAVRAAARDATIRAVVADSVWAEQQFRLDRLASPDDLPLLPYAEPLLDLIVGARSRDARPVDDAASISPNALLLVRAADDSNATTTADAQARVFAAAREPKQAWTAPSGGHIGALGAHRDEYERRVLAFFERYLRG